MSHLFELFFKAVDLFLHLDRYLGNVIGEYGVWTYLILCLVVFCETGLVVTPLLPGDSLLFAAGTFCSLGVIRLDLMIILLCIAAIGGDTVNYWIGHKIGPAIFKKEDSRFFKKKYLERTHAFYEKHGGKTIIIARFMPIIRTFAPFVAGIGAMSYGKFIIYNIIGGAAWVMACILAGYFFGNIPFIKNNLTIVVFTIIFLSILPAIIQVFSSRKRSKP
jgi:membrane-associated protein